LVREFAPALTQRQVILDRDLDAILGGAQSGRGCSALPFRCFDWADELAAKERPASRGLAYRPSMTSPATTVFC
jgi:hypothetical protein